MEKPGSILLWLLLAALPQAAMAGDRHGIFPAERPAVWAPEHRIVPQRQTEKHTCGFHAMQTVYLGYGLHPGYFELRERLGVDRRALPLLADSEGSIHPDMLRVLDQDGFAVEVLRPGDADAASRLAAHTADLQLAPSLIRRKENAHLHWIVIFGLRDGRLRIADSMRPESVYEEPYADFARTNIITMLLVKPKPHDTPARMARQHRRGLAAMLAVMSRGQITALLLVCGILSLVAASVLRFSFFLLRAPGLRFPVALAGIGLGLVVFAGAGVFTDLLMPYGILLAVPPAMLATAWLVARVHAASLARSFAATLAGAMLMVAAALALSLL